MDVILIPGLWLDASSWDAVIPGLVAAGHRTRSLTLPGLESPEADRAGITLQDHVGAVVDVVDSREGPVVLVGHSGGGAIAHAVADARPERVARVVYVDAMPLGDGGSINDGLPAVDGEIPLPEWSFFDAESLLDLDDELRAAIRARAIPSPQQVAHGPQRLSDERRYDVPVTIIACEVPSSEIRKLVDQGHPYVQELAKVREVEYADLPTGHWPQFTRPAELAEAVVAAIGKA